MARDGERVLTQRELNRALLARQLLLERGRTTIPRALEATLMRATIHLVSKRDFWPFAVAIRDGRRGWWLRVNQNADPKALRAAARRLRRFLADGPRRWKEIQEFLGEQANGAGAFLDLVRVPLSGTWERRRAGLYMTAEGLDRAGERRAGGSARPPRAPLPRRIRADAANGHRRLGRPPDEGDRPVARAPRRVSRLSPC